MSKTVRYAIDLANLPPLTDQQKADLAALAQMPDAQIDYSDIPPAPNEFWNNAILREAMLQALQKPQGAA